MNFKTRVTFSTLICFFAWIALLITCVDFIATNRHFYNYEYSKLNTAETIGMSESNLYEACDTLLDYLEDYRDDIEVSILVQGEERNAFNLKETLHMVDVKKLYQNALIIRNIFVLFVIILLALLCYDDRKGLMYILTYTYQRFFLFFSFVVGALITYAACDFETFWTLFHKVFFTNNLWLLDPTKSIMINMFPQEFFFTMVFSIALMFVFIVLSLWICCILYQRKQRKVELVN